MLTRLPRFDALYEEFLGYLTPSKTIGIYKNPKNIKRMETCSRAISDKNGNLFVIDDGFIYIHQTFLEWLKDNTNYLKGVKLNDRDYVEAAKKLILWQRYDLENIFLLSQTYVFDRYKLKNREIWLENVKKKNPNFEFLTMTRRQYEKQILKKDI